VVRQKVSAIEGDRRFSEDIQKIHSLIESGELLRSVEEIAGNLN
jgi:histidine ammonia-lyase